MRKLQQSDFFCIVKSHALTSYIYIPTRGASLNHQHDVLSHLVLQLIRFICRSVIKTKKEQGVYPHAMVITTHHSFNCRIMLKRPLQIK